MPRSRSQGAAEELVRIGGQIAALEEQIAQLRQAKSRAEDESKAAIKAAWRRGDDEVRRLKREADEIRAALGGGKPSAHQPHVEPTRRCVVPADGPAAARARDMQSGRLHQDRERKARISELRRLTRRAQIATGVAVKALEAYGRRAVEEFRHKIAALEEQEVLLHLETARINADAAARVEAGQRCADAEAGPTQAKRIDEALLAVKRPKPGARRLKAEAKEIENALMALERPPGAASPGLRCALARWAAASVPVIRVDRSVLLLLVVPGVRDVSDPIVRYALRLEAGLIASLLEQVPRPLRRAAARLILQAVVMGQPAAPIWRLAADPRMQSVWAQLQRRAGEGRYLFPGQIDFSRTTDCREFPARTQFQRITAAGLDQVYAMVTLLAFAVRFYQDNESIQTLDVVTLLREAIAKLRQASGSSRIELSNGEVYDVRVGEGAAGRATLDRFADAIERELESRWELVVSRHRSGNPRLRAFLVRLAAATHALFDRSFAGCVATIASVLFDQQVARSRVWSCAVQAVTNRRALDASHTKELDARRAAVADRYALNVLPVVREIQDAGTRTLRGIADELNRRSVPTPRGRKWYASSVRNLLARAKWVIP